MLIAPVGQISSAATTDSRNSGPGFSLRTYRKPSLRISNTSGHICVHAPVEAQLSKFTLTFIKARLVEADYRPAETPWRSKAHNTARNDAVIVLGSVPTPQRTLPSASAPSIYATAIASEPWLRACST